MPTEPDKALLGAIERKDVKAATAALDAGASANAKTVTNMPALHLAIGAKSKTLVKLLASRGADPDAVDRKTTTALYLMADAFPDVALGTLLLDKGADPNKRSGETAPLHRAVKRPTLAFAELLLARGAKIDLQDDEGCTPLHVVIKGGTWEMTKTDVAAAMWLLGKGAGIAVADHDGHTPLLLAARHGHNREIFDALFERGAAPTADAHGMTALHHAVSHTSCTHAWLWQLLLDKGCDLDARDHEGETPLHTAGVHWNKTAVKFLIGKGADVTIKSKRGLTVLDNAKQYKQTEIIAILTSPRAPAGKAKQQKTGR